MTRTTSGMGTTGNRKPVHRGIPVRARRESQWEPQAAGPSRRAAGPCPCCAPCPAGPPSRSPRRLGPRPPAVVFFAALLCGFALLAGVSVAARAARDRRAGARRRRSGARTRARSSRIVADRTPFLTDVSEVGSAVGGAPVLPILVGLDRARLRRAAPVADRRLRGVRARRRVGDLPRDLAARPARAALRPAPGGPPGGRELSVGPHRRVDRGLRRARPAAQLGDPEPRAAPRRLGASPLVLPVFVAMSRMYRGMHHPLDVAGGVIVGIGAVLVLLFACRAAAAAAAARAPARSRSAVGRPRAARRWRHEGRRRRARRQAPRRRAARAAPRAGGGGHRGSALVRGAEGQAGAGAGAPGARGGRRAGLRLGRRRHRAAVRRRARRGGTRASP